MSIKLSCSSQLLELSNTMYVRYWVHLLCTELCVTMSMYVICILYFVLQNLLLRAKNMHLFEPE